MHIVIDILHTFVHKHIKLWIYILCQLRICVVALEFTVRALLLTTNKTEINVHILRWSRLSKYLPHASGFESTMQR